MLHTLKIMKNQLFENLKLKYFEMKCSNNEYIKNILLLSVLFCMTLWKAHWKLHLLQKTVSSNDCLGKMYKKLPPAGIFFQVQYSAVSKRSPGKLHFGAIASKGKWYKRKCRRQQAAKAMMRDWPHKSPQTETWTCWGERRTNWRCGRRDPGGKKRNNKLFNFQSVVN